MGQQRLPQPLAPWPKHLAVPVPLADGLSAEQRAPPLAFERAVGMDSRKPSMAGATQGAGREMPDGGRRAPDLGTAPGTLAGGGGRTARKRNTPVLAIRATWPLARMIDA